MYKTLEDIERVIGKNKPAEVVESFIASYLQGQAYEAWIESLKAEHSSLYPEKIDGEPLLDEEDNKTGEFEQIDNPDFISFDVWMEETESVESGRKKVIGDDGLATEVIVFEDKLLREYQPVEVDVDAWKADSLEWKQYTKNTKERQLSRLTVTTSTGKVFYADPTSRSDLAQALVLGQANGINETTWKLAEEFEGSRYVVVTLAELGEAAYIALQTKGQIVGAV